MVSHLDIHRQTIIATVSGIVRKYGYASVISGLAFLCNHARIGVIACAVDEFDALHDFLNREWPATRH